MVGETHFQRYIPDAHPENLVAPDQIRRHIICTGQVYHTLMQEREDKGITDVAISRLEQISPFPYDLVRYMYFGMASSFTDCISSLAHSSPRQVPQG